jgi:hypothetical protein
MNRLIVIGFKSDKTDVRSGLIVDVIDFEDEFYVYDAWGA